MIRLSFLTLPPTFTMMNRPESVFPHDILVGAAQGPYITKGKGPR